MVFVAFNSYVWAAAHGRAECDDGLQQDRHWVRLGLGRDHADDLARDAVLCLFVERTGRIRCRRRFNAPFDCF